MSLYNNRHRADIEAFYVEMWNNPDLYLSLYQQACEQSDEYVPTLVMLGNDVSQYKVFKLWMKNKSRKLNNKEIVIR